MKKLLSCAAAAILACAFDAQGAAAQSANPEVLKAAITFNIIRFVEFPRSRPGEPIQLCISRAASGAREMAALAGQRVGDRTVLVRAASDAAGCHVVYLGQASQSDIARSRQRGAIVVGDGPGFIGAGGTVGLVKTGNQVRFEVNLRASREAGVAISSRLLRLASRVQQ